MGRPHPLPEAADRTIGDSSRLVDDEGFQLRRTLFGDSDIVERQRRAIQRWRTAVLERRESQPLLAERARERHERLRPVVGHAVLDEVERRLTLLAIDRCWSDHLTELREMREDSVLLAFAGRFPRGAGYGTPPPGGRGANLRLTEFQAGLLLAQMTRVEEQSRIREENARYLTQQLREIPGILPARMHEGCTRNAYHLYMVRYRKEAFAGLPRERFLAALRAEGVPCSGGYAPLNQEPLVKATLASRGYRKVFPPEVLAAWEERNRCPANDRLCEEAVWFTQTMLLGPRRDMDDIVSAIRRIQASAAELARA